MGQHCLARWHLLSVIGRRRRLLGSVTLSAGGPPGTWAVCAASAVGRPTLHGGPVLLRGVKTTACFSIFEEHISQIAQQLNEFSASASNFRSLQGLQTQKMNFRTTH